MTFVRITAKGFLPLNRSQLHLVKPSCIVIKAGSAIAFDLTLHFFLGDAQHVTPMSTARRFTIPEQLEPFHTRGFQLYAFLSINFGGKMRKDFSHRTPFSLRRFLFVPFFAKHVTSITINCFSCHR